MKFKIYLYLILYKLDFSTNNIIIKSSVLTNHRKIHDEAEIIWINESLKS